MKIAIYYTHRESLGHATRSMRIARHLKSLGNDVLVIQGGKKQEFMDFSGVNVFNLPLPMYDKGFYHIRGSPVDFEKARKRALLIKKKLREFMPDIFIIEYFPLGRSEGKYEIYPVIKWLKNKMPKTSICSSVGYPLIKTRKIESTIYFSKLFDRIFIHSPRIEYEYMKKSLKSSGKAYEQFFDYLKEKIVFTGYVLDKSKPKKIRELPDGKKIILVSRGGGVANPNIISKSILSLRGLGNEYFIIACYGPSSGKREITVFDKFSRMSGNVKTFNYVPNFMDYLNECSVSVSMAGYNTSVETMWLRKRSVLVPYKNIEQISRAGMMKDVMGSSVLGYNGLKHSDIAREVKKQMGTEKANTAIKDSWFNGLENLSKSLSEI